MKSKAGTDIEFFRTEKIPKILLQIAPPVMLAQLIQAMYNIVDSFFVGKYSEPALTALSVIYPLQLIIIALAWRACMHRKCRDRRKKQREQARFWRLEPGLYLPFSRSSVCVRMF